MLRKIATWICAIMRAKDGPGGHVDLKLPYSHLTIDGKLYEPPEWIIRDFLPKLMDLDQDEYLKLRQWLCPANFFFAAINAAQNPLLPALFNTMVNADRFAYLSQYTPPPGVRKQ